MNEIIAKKYVGALLAVLPPEQVDEVNAALGEINSAFASSKFIDILNFPGKSGDEKANFLLGLTACKQEKFVNFLRTLAKEKRLEVLPQIAREFSYQKALKDNTFKGVIYSSFELSDASKKELEEKFSKKLNAKIHFDTKKSSYDGIKIELEDLGFEASFSMDLFKTKLCEHILKAIQ